MDAAAEASVLDEYQNGRPAILGWLLRRAFRRFALSPSRQSLKRLASFDEGRGDARCGLETADDHIDIERIKLDAATEPAGLVSGHEGGSGTQDKDR